MASASLGQDASNTLQSTNFDNEKTFIANSDDASISHTGHFYEANKELLSKKNPTMPLAVLPRSSLFAEPKYLYENGFSAKKPYRQISNYADCLSFTGLTRYQGTRWLYYGGSE